MVPPKKIDEATIARIKSKVRRHWSVHNLCEHFGLTRKELSKIIDVEPQVTLDEATIKLIRRKYKRGGSVKSICARFGLTPAKVAQIIGEHALPSHGELSEQFTDRGAYLPSPDEIREAAAKIRATWGRIES